jgi:hypothetical protein
MPVEQVDQLIISPNPATNKITIRTPELSSQFLISIFNLSGQEVHKQTVNDPVTVIDIAFLPAGVYFLRLTNERTVSAGKFIKQINNP